MPWFFLFFILIQHEVHKVWFRPHQLLICISRLIQSTPGNIVKSCPQAIKLDSGAVLNHFHCVQRLSNYHRLLSEMNNTSTFRAEQWLLHKIQITSFRGFHLPCSFLVSSSALQLKWNKQLYSCLYGFQKQQFLHLNMTEQNKTQDASCIRLKRKKKNWIFVLSRTTILLSRHQATVYYKKQNIASLSLAQVKQCLFYVPSIHPSIFLTACLTQDLERAGAFPAGGYTLNKLAVLFA